MNILMTIGDKNLRAALGYSVYPTQEVTTRSVTLWKDFTYGRETEYRYTGKKGRVIKTRSRGTGNYRQKAGRIIFEFKGEDARIEGTLTKKVLRIKAGRFMT